MPKAQRLGPDLRQQLQEGLEQIDQRLKVRGLRSWGQIYYFLYLRKLAQKAAFLEFFSKILAIVSSGNNRGDVSHGGIQKNKRGHVDADADVARFLALMVLKTSTDCKR